MTNSKDAADRAAGGRWAVEIDKPGMESVRIGPFRFRWQAEDFVTRLDQSRNSTAMPEGTTWRLALYIEELPHTDPFESLAETSTLAELMEEEPPGDGLGTNFPDLYTRLECAYGTATAMERWAAAGALLDGPGDDEAEVEDATARVQEMVEKHHPNFFLSYETPRHKGVPDIIKRESPGNTSRDIYVTTTGTPTMEVRLVETTTTGDPGCHLEMHDDSWVAFTELAPLFEALSAQGDTLHFEELLNLLEELGFVDTTDRSEITDE